MKKQDVVTLLKQYFEENHKTVQEIADEFRELQLAVLENYVGDELSVLKKNGSIEPYNKEKIYHSLAGASDSAGQPMTAADIELIISDVENIVEKTSLKLISTQKLRESILHSLIKNGYSKVAESYQS